MTTKRKPFSQPPKKHQPKGINVLFEDHDLLVVNKSSGLLSISTDQMREKTAYYLLTDYVRRGNSKSRNRIFIVHRLDRDTSGVLVFAKTESGKHFLQDHWHDFSKQYHAVIRGALKAKSDIIESYLAENSAHKMYSVSDPELGKLSRTKYRVLKESGGLSVVEIELLTGRKNQIRAHFAERGCPVVGDGKYGRREKGERRLSLHSSSLRLIHPVTNEEMTFTAPLPKEIQYLLGSKAKLPAESQD